MIPAELRERRQWVVWRLVQRPGEDDPTKEPWQVDGSARASTTNPKTWATFAEATAAHERGGFDGVGFVFTPDDPYLGVDLDDKLSEADRAAIALKLDSYTETSYSGNGMHVIVRAALNGHGRKRGGFEVYDAARYFVMTGQHVRGTPTSIEDRQAELEAVLARFLPAASETKVPTALASSTTPVDLDDRELLERAFAASNGAKFTALWNGDTSDYDGDDSRADSALCTLLGFYTGRDAGRVDRLFRRSGLMRDKWDSRRGDTTYGAVTIANALAQVTDIYTPPRPRPATSSRPRPTTPPDGLRASESVESVGDSQGRTERDGLTDSALKESVGPESVSHRGSEGGGTDSDPESVTVAERPFALPVREFVALDRPRAEPLLEDADGRAVIGRKSLTLLGARGGQGKTTLALDAFLHLAAGVDWLCFTVPRPVSVLIIENEGPEELFAEKLAERLEHFPHPLRARLDVCTFEWGGFSLADDGLRARLAREIDEKGYDLVFGDPLDSLGIEGVGSPEDTRKFLELMKRTGLNRSVAWWLNTHPRKEETREALDEIAGAWGGKPDSVLLLRMLLDDRAQVRFPKLRWAKRGRRPPILLGFDAETEAFSYLGEESEETRDYLAEIVALLGDGVWRTPKEIAKPKPDGIGANVDTIKEVLEEHPDVFESRTGEAAKLLGRSPRSTVWQFRGEEQAE